MRLDGSQTNKLTMLMRRLIALTLVSATVKSMNFNDLLPEGTFATGSVHVHNDLVVVPVEQSHLNIYTVEHEPLEYDLYNLPVLDNILAPPRLYLKLSLHVKDKLLDYQAITV